MSSRSSFIGCLLFNEWIACKIYFMARVFEGHGDALGVRWRQVGLAASSVSRKLSANCCDGRALKIWGLIEGWGVAEDKNEGKRGQARRGSRL